MQSAFGWSGGHIHQWSIRAVQAIDGYDAPLRTDLNRDGFHLPHLRTAWRGVDHPRPDLPEPLPFIPETPEDHILAAEMAEDERIHGGPFRFSEDDDYGLPPTETISYLDGIYNLTGMRRVLWYEYDFSNSWDHVVMVEKGIPAMAKITGGSGHSIAEDVGGPEEWEELKRAYADSGTQRDTQRSMRKRI